MDDREAYEFYLDPEHRKASGPGRKRNGPRLSTMLPVRFTPEVIEAVREIAVREGVTVSSWIRRLVDREIAPPETVDFTLDDGTAVRLPADAMRAIAGRLTPLMLERGDVSITFGSPWRADEKRRREAALATTHQVLGGRAVPPRSIPSSLGTFNRHGRTFTCQHMSIGGVVSAECWVCGPLTAAA